MYASWEWSDKTFAGATRERFQRETVREKCTCFDGCFYVTSFFSLFDPNSTLNFFRIAFYLKIPVLEAEFPSPALHRVCECVFFSSSRAASSSSFYAVGSIFTGRRTGRLSGEYTYCVHVGRCQNTYHMCALRLSRLRIRWPSIFFFHFYSLLPVFVHLPNTPLLSTLQFGFMLRFT